jgi:hypothetical protein
MIVKLASCGQFPTRPRFAPLASSLAFCTCLALASGASAQTLYVFKDESQLTVTMLRLAALTTMGMPVPDPCRLHILTIVNGEKLFSDSTSDAMNRVIARAIIGSNRLERCEIQTHSLNSNAADKLFTRLKPQGEKVHLFESIYIPIGESIYAYTRFRDGTGKIIGQSERFDLPVVKVEPELTTSSTQTAAVLQPKPKPEPKPKKEASKLLTEVHFDPGSANITYVGQQKIQQAIEAIKKRNPREVRILGFTDSKGSAEANKVVATARANNVAKALKDAGLNVSFVVEGRGEGGGPYKIPDGISEPLNRCVGIIAVGGDDGGK